MPNGPADADDYEAMVARGWGAGDFKPEDPVLVLRAGGAGGRPVAVNEAGKEEEEAWFARAGRVCAVVPAFGSTVKGAGSVKQQERGHGQHAFSHRHKLVLRLHENQKRCWGKVPELHVE